MSSAVAQSRSASLAEAAANTIAGFVLAVIVQRVAYPLFGIETSLTTDGLIAALFTVTSLARSYYLRRIFIAFDERRLRQRAERQPRLKRRFAPGG